jgi:hypothetical protein
VNNISSLAPRTVLTFHEVRVHCRGKKIYMHAVVLEYKTSNIKPIENFNAEIFNKLP